MRRILFAVILVALAVAAGSMPIVTAASPDRSVRIEAPDRVTRGRAFAITVRLPGDIAAVDGRVLMARGAGELLGVAPLGRGWGLRPVPIRDGAAFGAYGLHEVGGETVIRLVLVPERSGRTQFRVLIDAIASPDGRRLSLDSSDALSTVGVDGATALLAAPKATATPNPVRSARPVIELEPDGRLDKADEDVARHAWESVRLLDRTCGSVGGAKDDARDANDDGCVDVVDLQALVAARGTGAAKTFADVQAQALTFTVNNTADTEDAARGNGVCADSQGRCTLRAAIQEANHRAGADRIEFALPGSAPVLIQLTGELPDINSRAAGVTIDGYTQPGSRLNDATVGSNAIPGVEIRGNGSGAREMVFYITSADNTIRGLLINNAYRSIMVDRGDAHGNRIVGNLIGFLRDGTNASAQNFAVTLNTGSHDNYVGTPVLADRNVIGNHSHAVEVYGPGTNYNVIQNNVFCIRPSGMATAGCNVGVDHNFGPKYGLIGGTGPNERNVIGRSQLQGIEYSHGWNPAVGNNDPDPTYHIDGNRSAGNWVGFRGNGSYHIDFRSGQNDQGSSDNGNGINVYDGSNDNVIEANYVASRFDGIQTMSPNSTNNTIRDNIIGISPLGQPAPMGGWGIRVRDQTRTHTVEGNTIRNAALGGVGLTHRVVYRIRISRNIVSGTNGPAIDLYGVPGPDPNDVGDGDNGANNVLNTPVITSATIALISGTARSGSTVEVFRASRPAGQFGLPVEFLGQVTVAPNGTWSVPVALVPGDLVTALQIATNNDTSELASNVAVS